jgi:hypothetical protein
MGCIRQKHCGSCARSQHCSAMRDGCWTKRSVAGVSQGPARLGAALRCRASSPTLKPQHSRAVSCQHSSDPIRRQVNPRGETGSGWPSAACVTLPVGVPKTFSST